MKIIAFSVTVGGAAVALALLATPASAQIAPGGGVNQGPGHSPQVVLGNPADIGLVAVTPSRISSSRREMNRGRNDTPFQIRMSPRESRRHARDLLQRADIDCDVSDAVIAAYTDDGLPLMEVDCAGTGGLVIADTLPIQATDCLDIPPPEEDEQGFILTCSLPGNVAVVNAARQSARN